MKRRTPAGRPGQRRDRLIREREHDPYRARQKPPEPTVCPDCGASFGNGRWRWQPGPVDAPRSACPACQRIRDRYPAGYVTLRGEFPRAHRDEIIALARNLEAREKAEHPLKRIIEESEEDGDLVITTTDMHLARTIGDSVRAAYAGELDYQYSEEGSVLRLYWTR